MARDVAFEVQKIRATITFGGISVSTPHVLSFNVKRSRGQPSATFQASVRIDADRLDGAESLGDIVIKAGVAGRQKTVFTGYVLKATMSPCKTDANKVIVSLAGKDVMYKLEGKKVTRRVAAESLGRFAVITGIVRQNVEINERFSASQYVDASEELISKSIDLYGELGVIHTKPMYPNRDGATGGEGTTPFTIDREE